MMNPETMYTIQHKITSKDGKTLRNLDIRLGVLPIENLILHEKTREHSLKKLSAKIAAADSVWHPIIVDSKTHVILDGMHRTTACKALGFRFMGVALLDAMDPAVGLGKWNRSFYGGNTPGEVIPTIEKLGIKLESTPYKECDNWAGHWDNFMSSNKVQGILIDIKYNKSFLVHINEKTVKELYDRAHDIEAAFSSLGYRNRCICDKNLLEETKVEDTEFLFIPPPLSKQDILDTCLKGEAFSPKASCFFLPVRPMFVDFPITLLRKDSARNSGMTIDEITSQCNLELKKILEKKKLIKIRGNVTLDRFYQEDYLYIFDFEKRQDIYEEFKDHIVA